MRYTIQRLRTNTRGFTPLETKGQPEKKKRFLTGFTLAEILVSVAIAIFVISGVYAVLNVANISWFTDMGMLDLQQNARLAIDGMTREIRQSSSQEVAISGGGEKVVFSIPDVSDTIAYYLNNSQLIREHPAGTEKVIAYDVSSLDFSSSGDIVAVQLGLAKTVQKRDLSFSLREKVRLRNE